MDPPKALGRKRSVPAKTLPGGLNQKFRTKNHNYRIGSRLNLFSGERRFGRCKYKPPNYTLEVWKDRKSPAQFHPRLALIYLLIPHFPLS